MTEKKTGDNLKRFLRDVFNSEQDPERQLIRWLEETIQYCELLEQGASTTPKEVRYVFWVRLYGVIHDVSMKIEGYEAFHAENLDVLGDPNETTLHQIALGIRKTLSQARDALTSDEWIYVAFRRHFETHPFQDAFRIKFQNGKISEPGPILKNKYTVEERKAALRRVRATHNQNDTEIAIDFATRVRPVLIELKKTVYRNTSTCKTLSLDLKRIVLISRNRSETIIFQDGFESNPATS